MKGIVWLASYPKSGNTWFRVFLANLLSARDRPVDINALGGGPMASSRETFDEMVGYDSGEMTCDAIDRLRPEVYLHQARTARDTLFCKAHDAYVFLPDGRALFPPAATAGALYFIRNPLDVCVSLTRYSGHDRYDSAIAYLADANQAICEADSGEAPQLRQRLLSWSGHVLSWADAPGVRVHVVRYEDMKLRPLETFAAAARFVDLPDEPERVKRALEFSGFEELQRQEQRGGFGERPAGAAKFFRKGEVGTWREVLTRAQVEKIVADHGDVMRRFGYLDENDAPVF